MVMSVWGMFYTVDVLHKKSNWAGMDLNTHRKL